MNTFTSPAAANAAGIELRSQGKLSEAIEAFRAGTAQFPSIPALHQNLAQALYESGDTAGAIAEHRRVLAVDPHSVTSNFALYELLQITGDRVLALAHQRLALEEQRLFSHVAPRESRSILFLCAPGDWQANIPVDFLLDPETTTVHKLYLIDQGYLTRDAATVPRYDVLWNAIAESPDAISHLELAARIIQSQHKPVLNEPAKVVETSRLRLPDTLRNTGVVAPHVQEVRREDLGRGAAGMTFPVIARPIGSHAGIGLARLSSPGDCAAYVKENEAQAYYVSPFVDYASDDGFYRKYRIVFVDGTPYPVHLAVSPNWMIHYYNAPMAEHQWMRDEEATFLADIRAVFDGERFAALEAVTKAVGLQYFGIDCSIGRDGRILMFEADPAMLVHTSDPADLYPYKKQYIPRIYRAVERMIDRHKTADT